MSEFEDNYVPSQAEIDEYCCLHYKAMMDDFNRIAARENYPLRRYRVFNALVRIANGRHSFITGVGAIMAYSRHCRRTVFAALKELEKAEWIIRHRQKDSANYWWVQSRYVIPRLRQR